MKQKWLVADFETTSENFYNENGYTKVWLYAICDSDGEMIKIGDSIEDFINICSTKLIGKKIYFHNLKFDGMFILHYLLDNNYEYSEEDKMKPKTFKCLIGEMGEFYSIELCFAENKIVHFVDSLKLLPFKVEYIAKSFNLPIRKEKIDYENYDITPQKISYISNDVRIVAYALKELKENGFDKMTTASSAYSNFSNRFDKRTLEYLFPELPSEFLIEYRHAYRGGRCQVQPNYADKIVKNVYRFDINSMYPYIMHSLPLPYGKPKPIKEMGKYRFELYKVRMEFFLKDDNMPTLLKAQGMLKGHQTYYECSDGIEEIYISNIDLEIMKRHYVILKCELIEGYGFATSNSLFKDYVEEWYEVKNNSKYGKKQSAKLMLNCLYGKYGSNLMKAMKIPYLDDEVLKFKLEDEKEGKKYYLPVAIAVTSWAHKLIDDAITEVGYDNFIYTDTDSVHTFVKLPSDMIDKKELGKFKLEAIESKARYVRQKTYVHKDLTGDDAGKYVITCAGMTEDMKKMAIKKFKDAIMISFTEGFTIGGKKVPKRVKGGVVLHETTFKIK